MNDDLQIKSAAFDPGRDKRELSQAFVGKDAFGRGKSAMTAVRYAMARGPVYPDTVGSTRRQTAPPKILKSKKHSDITNLIDPEALPIKDSARHCSHFASFGSPARPLPARSVAQGPRHCRTRERGSDHVANRTVWPRLRNAQQNVPAALETVPVTRNSGDDFFAFESKHPFRVIHVPVIRGAPAQDRNAWRKLRFALAHEPDRITTPWRQSGVVSLTLPAPLPDPAGWAGLTEQPHTPPGQRRHDGGRRDGDDPGVDDRTGHIPAHCRDPSGGTNPDDGSGDGVGG